MLFPHLPSAKASLRILRISKIIVLALKGHFIGGEGSCS
jgi:hypothetical protein